MNAFINVAQIVFFVGLAGALVGQQERVVHDALVPQELSVLGELLKYELFIVIVEIDAFFLPLEVDEVDVLERLASAGRLAKFHFSLDCASLEVEDAQESFGLFDAESVGEHHQVDFGVAFHMHCVDAENA